MSKKGGGKAPTIPRWENLIQWESDANRLDEYSPFGSAVYGYDPETGKRSRTTTYSPAIQALLDQQFDLMGDAYSNMSNNPITPESIRAGVGQRADRNSALADLLSNYRMK